jgi:hypothetical protein
MKQWFALLLVFVCGLNSGLAQTADTSKHATDYSAHAYFIISAGSSIKAYYNDKPVSVETIEQFDDYVQKNAKTLKNARVVVTGQPKTGTFDQVLKTLSKYKIKNVTKNISGN